MITLTKLVILLLVAEWMSLVDATFECVDPLPLGSQDGRLPDSSFTATSSSISREAFKARLHGQFAWRPRKMDSNEYLVVNFGTRMIITAVATQGRRASREYVTLYALQYSDNGMNWFYYTDGNKIIMVIYFILPFKLVHPRPITTSIYKLLIAQFFEYQSCGRPTRYDDDDDDDKDINTFSLSLFFSFLLYFVTLSQN